MKILHTIKKLWLLGFIIPVALAAPLLLPKISAQVANQFTDNVAEVLDKDTTVTKKTLNLIEASGTAGLDDYVSELKNIVTEFSFKGATHTVTIGFDGYNGCRGSGLDEATCTFGLLNQIKSNIQWASESLEAQLQKDAITDMSSEVTIQDLKLTK